MKKILVLIFGLMFVAGLSFAQGVVSGSSNTTRNTDSSSSNGSWLVQVNGGIVIPASSEASTVLNTGYGGDIEIGYAFDKSFSLGLEVGFNGFPEVSKYLPSGVNQTYIHIPVELVGQYNISLGTNSKVWPYILVGVGEAFDFTIYNQETQYVGASYMNFELDPGFGVAFAISNKADIFIQGKLAMDFEPVHYVGAEDNPLMYIPLQVGINFSLN